ncbi:15-hydroxyprostaglandin dehydrogenase [NAD(+)]-like [Harmonia axyridis]|uniref:15-hydroxyprostaglandin dehydrogenase [NAD(+)]-like n=1 Tax=Harmonia axyridis TaxID=115357 RepID=UPI001E27584A|nr:15-hydroxyprostaglandin dehydrogenase [NAD(+)]-like [Harmonia axyridis]
MFELEGKVALVTGGASGIGLEIAKRLLAERANHKEATGLRGVTIADVDQETGEKVVDELKREFGSHRVIFVKTDVSDKQSFQDAFAATVGSFDNIDILVNNAGIFNDCNYDKEIDVNFKGVVHGITLGLQYFSEFKSGTEAVIMNTASITGTKVYPSMPIYGSTKSAVVSLTMAFGDEIHYDRTKVRIVAIAPGFTKTNISLYSDLEHLYLDEDFGQIFKNEIDSHKIQPVEIVGENVIKIIKEKPSGTVWISEEEKDIFEYIPSRSTFKSSC